METTTSTPEPAETPTAQLSPALTHGPSETPTQETADKTTLVPNNMAVAVPQSPRFTNRIWHVRSRICRPMGMQPHSTFATCSLADLLNIITRLRLKHIPHRGSTLDQYLKQAETFVKIVNSCLNLINKCDTTIQLGSTTLWGCCEILLKVRISPWTDAIDR